MSHTREEKLEAIGRAIDVLERLRKDCPWDRKQTNESLRPNTIEETYELCDALLKDNVDDIKKELGDVLLHILFYSKIGEEQNRFDIAEVADALSNKLIFRHPHVFGETKVNGTEEVLQNWENLKLKEKGGNKSVLAGVPVSLPALIKAERIQEKACNVGFDWEKPEQAWEKFKEEMLEFENEWKKGNYTDMEKEMGDIIFSLVNVARLCHINAENALEKTNQKFISRFNYLENKVKESGRNLKEMTLGEMDEIWESAKTLER